MLNVTIKIKGALPYQEAEVKNVYVYYHDGQHIDRYVTRNVDKMVKLILEDLEGIAEVVIEREDD